MQKPADAIAIPADPDDPEDFDITEAALQQALVERATRRRGAQISPMKHQVTWRLDRDVVAKFGVTGKGWQARVNDALRAARP